MLVEFQHLRPQVRPECEPSHFICIKWKILIFRELQDLSVFAYDGNFGLKAILNNEHGSLSQRQLVISSEAYINYFRELFEQFAKRLHLEDLLEEIEIDFPEPAETDEDDESENVEKTKPIERFSRPLVIFPNSKPEPKKPWLSFVTDRFLKFRKKVRLEWNTFRNAHL